MILDDSSSLELSDSEHDDVSPVRNTSAFLGTPRQLCLRHCGFISVAEAEVCSIDALQAEVHPAWGVLLQHEALHTTHVVCRLLCTSRGTRAAVMLLCKGTLAVAPQTICCGSPGIQTADVPALRPLVKFLTRHAALVQDLDLGHTLRRLSDEQQLAASAVLSRALWEAKDSLCLQSLTVPLSCPALYQQVAAIASCRRQLTQLVVYGNDLLTPNLKDAITNTLKQLSGLRSLKLFDDDGIDGLSANILLPALSGLTKLTELQVDASRFGEPGLYLPASVQELRLGTCSSDWDPVFKDDDEEYYDLGLPAREQGTLRPFVSDLSRLTAVTKLDMQGDGCCPEHIYLGDKLPPNTRWLCVTKEEGWATPVIAELSCLTYLDLNQGRLSEAELGVLHQLTNLQEVCLTAGGGPDAVPAHDNCLAWPPLPVQSLNLSSLIATDRVLQQVAKLTRLTQLDISIDEGSTGSVRELVLTLQPLQQLRTLDIRGCRHLQQPTSPAPGPQQGQASLMSCCGAAVSGMRQLIGLHLEGLDFTRADMTLLVQLQQLKGLTLCDCSIDDYGLGVIAAHLTDLLNLNLSRNAGVADVALPIVGQQLRWLKQLFLHHTSVTDLGVQWLKQPSLKTVGLCGCKVTQGQLQGWEAVWQNCSWCWHNRH